MGHGSNRSTNLDESRGSWVVCDPGIRPIKRVTFTAFSHVLLVKNCSTSTMYCCNVFDVSAVGVTGVQMIHNQIGHSRVTLIKSVVVHQSVV